MLPPDVVVKWDECNIWVQAQLIAYNQIRCYEENEEQAELQKTLAAAMGAKVI